jgi:phytoene dehydrogenase-like protein
MNDAPRVTVAGGGLAGMTAALRLAERGYRVKLYEQKSLLGGDVASRPAADGVDLDVYPHMFLSWYHNFWRLLQDAGVDRSEGFIPFSSVKQLRRGDYPRFTGLTDAYSPRHLFQNLFSGVGPPADMFVFWYATIDLLAERLNPTMLLDDVSVTGFLHARPYMTERAAKACDNFITMVWAVPSYLAAAEDYRTYLSYSVASYKPPAWLATGSGQQRVIGPLTEALERAGVEIVRSVQVTRVSCTDGRVTEIGLQHATFDPESYTWVGEAEAWNEEVDELVLAVPPDALSSLVRTGEPGHSVVDTVPKLAELSRLRTQRIPILHLYFTRKLRAIPPEPVGLYDSRLALAFTDISQTWAGVPGFADSTVLSLSASDPYALPGTGAYDDGFAILRELAEYLDFDPGTTWGESSDIDWERTRYESNTDAQLFVNETGIDAWRPAAACTGISNLSFAGNFCANRIGMMTVESAVASGLEAARVIVERRGIGAPVEITEPGAGVEALYVWLRYAWAPYALAAKAWSAGTDVLRGLRALLTPT